MNKPLISVVIPIYNGEKYLEETLNSLKNQTYDNFEVFLINDYSIDNSINLIENLIKDDTRFKIITPEEKLGTASKGVEYAIKNLCNGEYFFYMSQDDFIAKDCFEKAINRALKTDADIIIPISMSYKNGKTKKITKYPLFNNCRQEINSKKAFVLSLKWHIAGIGFRKLELLKDFSADYMNSDEYYYRKSFLKAKKITFSSGKFFYRQDNPEAITKKIRPYIFDIMTTDIKLAELLIEYKFSKKIIDKRVKELLKSHKNWIKLYKDNISNFDNSGESYVKNALNDAKLKLENISKNQNLFFSKMYLKFHKLEEISNEQ